MVDTLIGATVNGYEILGEAGRGGMAVVYRAQQTSIGREVAFKLLPAELMAQDPGFAVRFEREVRLLTELQHPNILSVYDSGTYDNQPYIVTAFMAGGTLAERLEGGSLPLRETVRVICQMAEALNYVHEQGIVHRDVKPSNILLDESGNAFLSDFGIARLSEAAAHLTGTGMIGTPAYMAPEQFQKGEPGPASDLYALGLVLFECLTGRAPFEAETPVQMMRAQIEQQPPRLAEIKPGLPASLQQFMDRALAKNPASRYATGAEFSAALRQAASGRGIKRRRRALWVVPVLVILALFIGAVAYLSDGTRWVNAVALMVSPTASATSTTTLTPTSTATPEPSSTASPTPTETPSPTPIPVVGGGTGWIGFNSQGLGYVVDASCILYQIPGCDPNPQLLPQTSEGLSPRFGTWSPDGRYLAFLVTNRDGSDQLHIMEWGTNHSIAVSDPGNDPAWSPDGTRLAYIADSFVRVVEIDCLWSGGGESCNETVGNEVLPANPDWSPDGTKIVYTAGVGSTSSRGVRQVDIENGDGRYLGGDGYLAVVPRWNSTGTTIYFSGLSNRVSVWNSRNTGGFSDFYSLPTGRSGDDFLGGPLRTALNSISEQVGRYEVWFDFDISSDNRVVFSDLVLGNAEIWVTNLDTQSATQVTNSRIDNLHPSFSPDSNFVAFLCSQDMEVARNTTSAELNTFEIGSHFDLCVLDFRTNNAIRLTENGLVDRDVYFDFFRRFDSQSPQWQPAPGVQLAAVPDPPVAPTHTAAPPTATYVPGVLYSEDMQDGQVDLASGVLLAEENTRHGWQILPEESGSSNYVLDLNEVTGAVDGSMFDLNEDTGIVTVSRNCYEFPIVLSQVRFPENHVVSMDVRMLAADPSFEFEVYSWRPISSDAQGLDIRGVSSNDADSRGYRFTLAPVIRDLRWYGNVYAFMSINNQTMIEARTIQFEDSIWHTVRLEWRGDFVTSQIDNQPPLEETNMEWSSMQHLALVGCRGLHVQVDNILVETLP